MSDQTTGPAAGVNILYSGVSIEQTTEPGMFLTRREWQRTITKLEACKSRGLEELWLALCGIFAGLAAAAFAGRLAAPADLGSADKGYMVLVAVASLVIALVCIVSYFTTRENHNKVVSTLIGDMQDRFPTT